AVCVSKTVADDLKQWLQEAGIQYDRRRGFKIAWSHHGCNIDNSAPTLGMPPDADETLTFLKARPTFLMVGTIEPRKGYLQTIEAFTHLWDEGMDVNLVIVGKEGWQGLPDDMRRDIPRTIETLRSHPELNKRLFWLEGISDEYLEKVYAASTCLIAASYGEGFGLPLIEAAQHKLPIIARDIPVFREVAGEHAYYFASRDPDGLAQSIKEWLKLYEKGEHPVSDNIPWLTWKESAEKLQRILLERPSISYSAHDKAMEIEEHEAHDSNSLLQ
ncbi:MAG: glycosyltransferase family 4 protein, partial [Alphaproteobacteria bacterium]